MFHKPSSTFFNDPLEANRRFISRRKPVNTSISDLTDEVHNAKKHDHPTANPEAQLAASRAFTTIKNLIYECPEEYLIELLKKKTGRDFIPDFVAADISGVLSSLEQMAALGNNDAVERLAAIANRIGGFLDHLAGRPDDKVQNNVEKGMHTRRVPEKNRSWKRDYHDLSKALRVLIKLPPEDLRIMNATLDEKCPTICLLPDAIGMFTPSLHRHVLSHVGDESASASREPTQEEESLEELDLLLARLFEYRAKHLSRQAARQAIANAETWPIPVPALVDGRAERIEKRLREIKLGSGLGYDLSGTQLGRPREIITSQKTGQIYRIFLELNRERKAALKMSMAHRHEYEAQEKRQSQSAPSGETQEQRDTRRLREFHEWDSRSHWIRKAALLPPPTIEHLDAWTDAVFSYNRAVTARGIYCGLKGKHLGRVILDRNTQSFRLHFGICKECMNPVAQAQCGVCEATRTDILERIRNAEARELELFGSW